jgi:catechol 2,3-dioxygenase-like lactoylglutathione lyase family enzyme
MKLGDIQHIAIGVSDMEKSLAFYRDLLGLEVVADFEVEGNPGIEAVFGVTNLSMRYVLFASQGTSINLLEFRNPKGKNVARAQRACDQAIHHIAFIVDDVDAIHRELSVKGVEFTCPPQDLGLPRACAMRGPDGEIIELMQYRT